MLKSSPHLFLAVAANPALLLFLVLVACNPQNTLEDFGLLNVEFLLFPLNPVDERHTLRVQVPLNAL